MRKTLAEMKEAKKMAMVDRQTKIKNELVKREMRRKKRQEKAKIIAAQKPTFAAPKPGPLVKTSYSAKNYSHVKKTTPKEESKT